MEYRDLPTPEDFRNLSEEEKRETIRNLIQMIKEDSQAKAVLYNPIEHKSCSLEELIDSIGEDAVIDILVHAMEKGDMSPQSFTKDEINKAIERKRNGTATEEDEKLLEMFDASMRDSEPVMLNRNFTAVLIELIDFSQNHRSFYPSIGDFLATFNIITTITGMYSEGSSLEKYQKTGPSVIHEMSAQIADDILNTWSSSCTEVPDKYMLLCALLQAAQGVANDIKLCDVEVYKNILGAVIPEIDECHNECDCCGEECHCHSGSENGSNEPKESPKAVQPKTYKPSKDQEMRDMLKD